MYKKYVKKQELKFKYYKNFLEANWLKNDINYLKNKTIKTAKRIRREKHNVFHTEDNKITLSSDDKKII